MFFLYRLIINTILILSPIIIIFRILKNKEDPSRFIEKLGIFEKKSIKGKLIWFHGSSVGEILSIIPLVEKFEKNKDIKNILITSNTFSSSKVLKKFRLKKTIHQFLPIDSRILVKKFLSNWEPSVAIFIESEIWPNFINEINRKEIPLILINARMTKKTFLKWNNLKNFSKSIFNKFNLTLSQNKETMFFLKKLGSKNIKNFGNLKFSENKSIKNNNIKSKKLLKFFKSKNFVFGGISTHSGEEEFCGKIQTLIKYKIKNSLTVIIPRHIDRCADIIIRLQNLGLKVHLHSDKSNIDKKTDIYLVDSFGETNSFINQCNIVFLGGSVIKRGGQNPLEAIRLKCKVLHGPYTYNFSEVYALLRNLNLCFLVRHPNEVINHLNFTKNKKNKINKNFINLNSLGKKILKDNYNEVLKYI
tara:strand:+ start:196 stop:1446 length:1251 start_codon:yes stop_codon:yes gene_type:complete